MNGNNQKPSLGGRISGPEIESSISSPVATPYKGVNLKKPSKKIIVGLIVGLVVVLVGGAVALAFGLWNPSWNPFQLSPEKVIEQSIDNMSQVRTAHFKAIINATGSENGKSTTVKMKIEGDSDNIDEEHPKSQTSIDLSIPIEGVEMLFSAEMRSIDEVSYFKIGTLPLPFLVPLSAQGIDASNWTNKWFRLDPKEIGLSLQKISKEDQKKMEEEIKQLLSDYPVAKVVKKLPGEKIEGQSTYHYLLSLDKENLKVFLPGLMDMLTKYYPSTYTQAITEEERQKMLEDIDKFFETVGEINFELWIGKRDKLIYMIAGDKTFDASSLGKEGKGTASYSFEISLSKFNEPVEIKAPEESQSIVQLLMPLIQMFTETSGGGFPQGNQLPMSPTIPSPPPFTQ